MAKLIQLAKLVIELRRAQKAYFKNRLQGDLTRSKQLERAVDVLLDSMTLPSETPEHVQGQLEIGN
jgi:hypothetical protein